MSPNSNSCDQLKDKTIWILLQFGFALNCFVFCLICHLYYFRPYLSQTGKSLPGSALFCASPTTESAKRHGLDYAFAALPWTSIGSNLTYKFLNFEKLDVFFSRNYQDRLFDVCPKTFWIKYLIYIRKI